MVPAGVVDPKPLQKFKKPENNDAELERKLKERLPSYEKSKLMEIKIDSKSLMAKAREEVVSVPTQPMRKSTVGSIQIPTLVEKPRRKLEKRRSSRVCRTTGRKNSKSVGNREKYTIKDDLEVSKEELRLGEHKMKTASISPSSKSAKIDKEEVKISQGRIVLPRSDSPVGNAILEKSDILSQQTMSTQHKHSTPKSSENYEKLVESGGFETSDKQNQIIEGFQNEMKNLEQMAQIIERKKSLKLQQDVINKARIEQENRDYSINILKTKILFDFVRGKSGPPVRVGSASYRFPFERAENIHGANLKSRVMKENDFKTVANDTETETDKFFLNWLDNYELKKQKLQERMTRAKNYQNNPMVKWTNIIITTVYFNLSNFSYGKGGLLIRPLIKPRLVFNQNKTDLNPCRLPRICRQTGVQLFTLAPTI